MVENEQLDERERVGAQEISAHRELAEPPAVEVGPWYGSLLNTEKVVPPISVDELKAFIGGKQIKKVIVAKGKLVNVVVAA